MYLCILTVCKEKNSYLIVCKITLYSFVVVSKRSFNFAEVEEK